MLPIIVVLELEAKGKKGSFIKEIKVVNSYAKRNFSALMGADFLYVSPDKQKTNRWLKRTRLQLPVGINPVGIIKKITHSSDWGKWANAQNDADDGTQSARRTIRTVEDAKADYQEKLNDYKKQAKRTAKIESIRSVAFGVAKKFENTKAHHFPTFRYG